MTFYKIVIGDSRDMSEVKSSSVDLVITSPPYWMLDVFSKRGEPGWENDLSQIKDKDEFFRELGKSWKECWRVLHPGKWLVCEWEDIPVGSRIYGYPRELFLAGDMVKSIEGAGLYLISRWIWQKHRTGLAKGMNYLLYANLKKGGDPRAAPNWAYLFAFKKKALYSPKARKFEFGMLEWANKLCDGVWYIEASVSSGAGELITGGAVFPLELVERLIKIYTQPGDVILDCFGGTGTTMLAALRLGRSCILYECLEKMLPVIKAKVGYGSQFLTGEEVKWEIIKR